MLEQINKFSKDLGYEIKNKNLLFLYTSHELSGKKKKERETNPICSSIKNNKILGINLTKDVKDLCTRKCKTLTKEIEEYGIEEMK